MQDSWIYKTKKEIEFSYYQNMKTPSALRRYIHLIGKMVPKSAYTKDNSDFPSSSCSKIQQHNWERKPCKTTASYYYEQFVHFHVQYNISKNL